MRCVVFDIGNVLVDWQPEGAWIDELGTAEEVGAFLDRTSFFERNLRTDKGARFADVAQELSDPTDQALFASYPQRFARTVERGIPGSWALVDRLLANSVPLHAITNWSAETWPVGLQMHPRLGEIFGTTVVSGEVGLLKPDPEIYHLFCARAKVAPADCVFVDDRAENIAGARSIGMDGIHFTGADVLERGLIERGLL